MPKVKIKTNCVWNDPFSFMHVKYIYAVSSYATSYTLPEG